MRYEKMHVPGPKPGTFNGNCKADDITYLRHYGPLIPVFLRRTQEDVRIDGVLQEEVGR